MVDWFLSLCGDFAFLFCDSMSVVLISGNCYFKFLFLSFVISCLFQVCLGVGQFFLCNVSYVYMFGGALDNHTIPGSSMDVQSSRLLLSLMAWASHIGLRPRLGGQELWSFLYIPGLSIGSAWPAYSHLVPILSASTWDMFIHSWSWDCPRHRQTYITVYVLTIQDRLCWRSQSHFLTFFKKKELFIFLQTPLFMILWLDLWMAGRRFALIMSEALLCCYFFNWLGYRLCCSGMEVLWLTLF